MKRLLRQTLTVLLIFGSSYAQAQENDASSASPQETIKPSYAQPIFDDKMLLEGYTQKYDDLSKEILLEMIKDDTLSSYKAASAIHVFSQKYASEVVSKEKRVVEKILLRRLNRTDSPFVQVEVMCTLCQMDRYRYFNSMVPALIQKLNHYNSAVNDVAFTCLEGITQSSNNRAREARVVFNTLRKILFLSRKRLEKITDPDENLKQKIKLLRWSIKILGTEELNRLPKEIMHLL